MVADLEKHCRETYKGRLRSEFKAVMPPVYKRHLGGLDRIFCIPHSMEPQAFEAQKFQSALLPDDLKDRQSRDAFISRLKTTIRWRQCEDKETGALYKESNTRIVRWSDGSETLHIGAEAYELISHPTPLGHDHLYVRQNSHHYLIGPIREKMRLHSDIESKFGQTHVQPVSSCVSTNPMLDRERMIREDQAQERREKFEKMREQKNQCKPTVKPTRYCTAGDSNSAALAANQVSRPDDHVFRKPLLPPIKRAAGARAKRNTNVNVEQNEEDIDNDVEGKEKVSPGIKRKSNVKQVQPKPKRKQPPKAVLSDSE
ncbi:PREDICTED: RNA polymerase-associated protein LEO1 [Drosophila arizonae]|uniref:RNA polymerase-associated protein LEO1 n=1 Tax=Drosophila arizonae TaxID=7263 RepID=A0ABM1NRB6_DROAR|nr:PREDICTED: RNA polymerase-associated protein LEO1 [Drosophila arizonae]